MCFIVLSCTVLRVIEVKTFLTYSLFELLTGGGQPPMTQITTVPVHHLQLLKDGKQWMKPLLGRDP